ncbi:MAG: sialidase family protein [Planctomycetota bacterium]
MGGASAGWAAGLALALGACAGALAAEETFREDFSTLAGMEAQDVTQVREFPRVPLAPDVRIDEKGVGYFPTVARLQNGDLLVAWHEPMHGVDKEHGLDVTAYSMDDGKTWSKQAVAIDVPNVDDRDPILYQAPDGRVWLGAAGGHAAYSDDNGRSWSEPSRSGGYPVGVLSNGEFLWTCGGSYPEGWSSLKRRYAYVRGTRVFAGIAEGKITFERESILTELGDGDEWFLAETAVAGRMVAILRQQETGDYYHTSISTDYGKSFAPHRQSTIWHSPMQSRPLVMTMRDGTVVVAYGERQNNRVMLIASLDDAETWETRRKLVICDSRGLMRTDHSYPQTCQIDEHTLFSVWYAGGKIYGNFTDARFFRDVYRGVRLGGKDFPVDERTIAHWGFDEEEGQIVHDFARCNYGKMPRPERVEGRFGKALRFDGKSDYVRVLDCDVVRVPRWYTLCAWIRTEDATRDQTILDKGDAYYLGIEKGKLTYRTGEFRFESGATVPGGEWTHVAVSVWVANHYTYISFFLNGEQDSMQKLSEGQTYAGALKRSDMRIDGGPLYQKYYPLMDQRADALVIGNGKTRERRPFLGEIDEVRIIAEGLGPDELKKIYEKSYAPAGKIVGRVLELPARARWGRFAADVETPEGTEVRFSAVGAEGADVLAEIKPGDELSSVRERAIRIAAELRTSDPRRTPVVRGWSVSMQK